MTKQKKIIILVTAGTLCFLLIISGVILIKQYTEKKSYIPTPDIWDYNRDKDEYTNEASDTTVGMGVKQRVRVRDDKVTIDVDIDAQGTAADKQIEAIKEGEHVNSLIPYPYSYCSLYQVCAGKYESEGKLVPRLELSYSINGKDVRSCSYSYEEVNEMLHDEKAIKQACDDWYSLPVTEKDRQVQKEAEELNRTVTAAPAFAE